MPKDTLSVMENRVALLISQGLQTKEIALEVHRSFRTIESTRTRIYDKLGVTTSILMINKMLNKGLLTYSNGMFTLV